MKKSTIYTKTGDKGKTSLVGGKRVEKTHIRLDAYGTVDELNSFIGLLVCEVTDVELKDFLLFIQNKLFVVGSYLATETDALNPKAPLIIEDSDIEAIENMMDKLDSQLPKLTKFIFNSFSFFKYVTGSRTAVNKSVSYALFKVDSLINALVKSIAYVFIFLNR